MVHDVEEGVGAVLDEQDAEERLGIAYGGTLHGLHAVEAVHRVLLHRLLLGWVHRGCHF